MSNWADLRAELVTDIESEGFTALPESVLTLEECEQNDLKYYTIEFLGHRNELYSASGLIKPFKVKVRVFFNSPTWTAYNTNVADFDDLTTSIASLNHFSGAINDSTFTRLNNQHDKHVGEFNFYYGFRSS